MASSRFDDLLAAAADRLDHAGTAAVTLRDVASAVGISHNAPYRHFTSKQDLLEALIAREIEAMSQAVEQQSTAPTIQTLTLVFANWALAHPERFRLLMQLWPYGDREDLKAAMLRWDAKYTHAITTAQASGALPQGEVSRLGYLIRSTTLGSIQHYLSTEGNAVPKPTDLVLDLFRYLELSAQAAPNPR